VANASILIYVQSDADSSFKNVLRRRGMAWCGRFSIDGINESAAFCEIKKDACSQSEICKTGCKHNDSNSLVKDEKKWEGYEDPRQSTRVISMLHGII
jgi:hypothetical protein